MEKKTKKEILDTIADADSGEMLKRLKWRKENRAWLRNSQAIATKVLFALKEKGMSQLALAELMHVSPQYINKIIKGEENLSLETISKLERALGIVLMHIGSTQLHRYPVEIADLTKLSDLSLQTQVQKKLDAKYYIASDAQICAA